MPDPAPDPRTGPAPVGPGVADRVASHPSEVIAAVRDAGWAVIPELFGTDEAAAIDAVCADRRWPDIPDGLVTWIMDPRWAPVVTGVVGPDVRFLREQVVTKAPGSDVAVPWHQDSGYARVAGGFLTVFVALGPITEANGCLWMLGGSHRHGALDHVPAGNLRRLVDDIAAPGVPVILGPGDAVAFSSHTAHRSGGNHTTGTRPAWMVQFGPAGVLDHDGRPAIGCPLVAESGRWLDRPRFD